MVKNWLIRTKNNHILGPVSKDKIKQLISNGSIKGDDEVCSGNGYWVYIREQELVAKYVFSDEVQSFNPVTESEPILTYRDVDSPDADRTDGNGSLLPSDNDLGYPGENMAVKSQTNDTAVGYEIDKEKKGEGIPDLPGSSPQKKKPVAKKKTKKSKLSPEPTLNSGLKPKISTKNNGITWLSGKVLIFLTVLIVLVGVFLLYFRNSVVNKLIEVSYNLSPNAYAQNTKQLKKKSWFQYPNISSENYKTKLNITPFGIYIKSKEKTEFECPKEKLKEKDLILGFFLQDKSEVLRFQNCLNSHINSKLKIGVDINSINQPRTANQKVAEIITIYNKVMTDDQKGSTLFHLVEKLKKHNNLMARFLEAYLFMKIGNQIKANAILMKITTVHFMEYILNSDISDLGLEKQLSMSLNLLNEFSENLSNVNVFKSVLFYIYNNTNHDYREALDDEFSIPRGIKEVRLRYHSARLGRPYPYIWGPWLYENSSQNEYLKFIGNTKLIKNFNQQHPRFLLFFRNSEISNEAMKKNILKQMLKLKKSNNITSKFIYFEMINNNFFYKFLSANSKMKMGLILNAQRKHYYKVLSQSSAKQYALYRLLGIGDYNLANLRYILPAKK